MNTEDNLHLSKIERQVGTLKLAVLILGAALIYNSANKSGLLGEYKFVADKIEVKKIILKNSDIIFLRGAKLPVSLSFYNFSGVCVVRFFEWYINNNSINWFSWSF